MASVKEATSMGLLIDHLGLQLGDKGAGLLLSSMGWELPGIAHDSAFSGGYAGYMHEYMHGFYLGVCGVCTGCMQDVCDDFYGVYMQLYM